MGGGIQLLHLLFNLTLLGCCVNWFGRTKDGGLTRGLGGNFFHRLGAGLQVESWTFSCGFC